MRLLILFVLYPLIANTQNLSTYEHLVDVANNLVSEKSYKAAIDSLDEAIKIDSIQPLAYHARAKAKYKMDDYTGAIVDFKKICIVDPSFYFAYVYIADCNMKLGDFEGAIEYYERVLSFSIESNLRGRVLTKITEAELARPEKKSKKHEEEMQVEFMGQIIVIDAGDIISCVESPRSSKFNGDKYEAQLLDVNFTMPEEPIGNGMFVFGIETEISRTLTIEVLDEERSRLFMQCNFEITEGLNYKVLNVNGLGDGAYLIKIFDQTMKELNRELIIGEL